MAQVNGGFELGAIPKMIGDHPVCGTAIFIQNVDPSAIVFGKVAGSQDETVSETDFVFKLGPDMASDGRGGSVVLDGKLSGRVILYCDELTADLSYGLYWW